MWRGRHCSSLSAWNIKNKYPLQHIGRKISLSVVLPKASPSHTHTCISLSFSHTYTHNPGLGSLQNTWLLVQISSRRWMKTCFCKMERSKQKNQWYSASMKNGTENNMEKYHSPDTRKNASFYGDIKSLKIIAK